MIDIDQSVLQSTKTNAGNDLWSLSHNKPVLLVFLRHFGCIFCKEALNDLSKQRQEIDSKGVTLVFVHMADEETAATYFDEYGLSGMERIADPECHLYQSFGLLKGNFNQLYGLTVWLRGIETSVKNRNPFSFKQIGDGLQMPGIFYLRNGKVLDQFVHSKISDRPDYQHMIDCCAVS